MWPKTDAIGGPVLAARRGLDDPRDLLAHFPPPWYVQELEKKKKTLTGEKNGQAGRGCSKMLLKIEGSGWILGLALQGPSQTTEIDADRHACFFSRFVIFF